MLNYSTALDSASTSLNSYGSAMQEQEKYNQSLEARINRLSTAWYDFSNALGNTIVYDTLVVITSLLEKVTNTGADASGSMKALIGTISLLGTGALLASGKFRGYSANLIATTAAKRTTSVATTTLTGKMYALAAGTTVASNAFRAFLMTTGVGIGFVLLTTGITHLISSLSKAKQSAEEFDQYMKKNTSALGENKKQIDSLLQSYYAMSESNKEAWSTEQHEKYIDVQNQLAELFPAIIDYVDENGNAHIKSKDAIASEIEFTKKLIEAEKELKRARAQDTFKEALKESEKAKSTIDALRKASGTRGVRNDPEELARVNFAIIRSERELANASIKTRRTLLDITDAYLDAGVKIESVVQDHIVGALGNIDFDNLNPKDLESFAISLSDIMSKMSSAYVSGDKDGLNKVNQELSNLISTSKGLKPEVDNLTISTTNLTKAMSNKSNVVRGTADDLDELGGNVEDLSKKIEKLQENILNLESAEEQLAGVSNKTIQDSEDLIFLYEQLSNRLAGYTDKEIQSLYEKEKLSAAERELIRLNEQRADTISLLNVLYPQHTKLQKDQISLSYEQISRIKEEEKANKLLLDAYKLARDGKLTAEQEMTVASAQGVKNRIEILKTEIKNLEFINRVYDELNQKRMKQELSVSEQLGMMRAGYLKVNNPNASAIESKSKELEVLQKELDSSISKIDNFVSSINNSSSSTKSSIYITDEYKQALEKLNLEIEKQQKLLEKFSKHDTRRVSILQQQIKLEQEKLALYQKQSRELDSQIKSGKIKQTGNISDTQTSTQSLSGWSGSITSNYGYRNDPFTGQRRFHRGIDISGSRGTRLDANIAGTVVKSGSAKSQGLDSSYGNVVVIQDSNGFRHLYAHLDKAIAKVGDKIVAGQQIGTIGSTGRSTGSHLHYEVTLNGKTYDPSAYLRDAKNGITASIASTVNSTQQAIDEAKSTLLSINSEILNQQALIEELEFNVIETFLAGYEYRKQSLDNKFNLDASVLNNTDKLAKKYTSTLERQVSTLKEKQKVNREELAYLNSQINSGKLSASIVDDLQLKYNSLLIEIEDLNNELGSLELAKFEVFYSNIERYSRLLDYNKLMLETLSKGTERYGNALDRNSQYLESMRKEQEEALRGYKAMVTNGKYSGTVLEEITQKVQELTMSLQELALEIQNNNYEVIVNLKVKQDEVIDDLRFALDSSEIIQSFYEEGSGLWLAEQQKQIEIQEKIRDKHDASRKSLQRELENRELNAEQIKAITELMEDETIAYLNAVQAIKNLTKTAKDSTEKMLEDLYNEALNAYKDYLREAQDEKMKELDNRADAERKLHEQIMKQYKDEMDLFRKNASEMLELIDRQEAERDYNMEIEELTSNRNTLQEQINRLALDNSNEAKAKRKRLQEELDKIDKEIAEKRHKRDIDLQKQTIQDSIEAKENEIEIKEELEDKRYENLTEQLSKERNYWSKHYTDLLNDERKFAEMKRLIMEGHFGELRNLFDGYVFHMERTLPSLADTLDGTMSAVGTSIRQNVIDRLKEVLNLMDDVKNAQSSTGGGSSYNGKPFTDNFDPNKNKDSMVNDAVNRDANKESLSNADLKVLVAKYMNEQLYAFSDNDTDKWWVKYKADNLAATGRAEGSKIPATVTLDSVTSNMSREDLQRLASYAKKMSQEYLNKPSHQDHMLNWANKIASLDSGGYLNFKGNGIDGKGGRLIIGHPHEVMLDKVDTKSLLEGIDIMDKTKPILTSILSKFKPNSLLSSVANMSPISIEFTGDIHNSNGQTGANLANNIVNGVRNRGGRI